MSHFPRSSLPLILVLAGVMFFACTAPPRPGPAHPVDHYLSLDQYLAQPDYGPAPGEIIPIEMVNNRLSILKERHRTYARNIRDLNYVGLIFRLGITSSGSLADHRLASLSHDPGLISSVVKIRKKLAKRNLANDGLVLLIDSAASIEDDQLQMLASTRLTSLMLNGLTYIGPKQARILAGFKGKSLCLDGLLWLGSEQAESFAEYSGDYLSFNSVRHLDPGTIKALCQFDGLQLHLALLENPSLNDFKACLAEHEVTFFGGSH